MRRLAITGRSATGGPRAAGRRRAFGAFALGAALAWGLAACAGKDEATGEAVGGKEAAATAGAKNPLMADRFLLLEVNPNLEPQSKGRADAAQSFAKLFENGQFEKAEEKARRVLRQEPYDKQALIHLITALLLEKKYTLANVYAGLNRKGLSNDPDFLNVRGVAAYQENRGGPEGLRLASEAFAAALKENPKHVAALLNQSYLQLETSRPDDAKEGFQEARKACKDCYLALAGLGQAHLKAGRFKEAVAALKMAADKQPGDYATLLLMAQVYFHGLKDKAKAEATVNRALEAMPKNDVDMREKAKELKRQIGGGAQGGDA